LKFDSASYRGKSLIDLPEKQLVRYIIQEASTLYDFLNFVVEPAIGPPPRTGWNYLFFAEVPRKLFGFGPGSPGDFDIVVVPTFDGRPQAEMTAAVEVKRLALRGPNWRKNVDRYGVTQAEGLLRCGFPFVGVLHLIVNAPGPTENWKELHRFRVVDEFGRCEFEGPIMGDMTGIYAAQRQYSRLTLRSPDSPIGLNCVAMTQTSDGNDKHWFHTTDPELRFARRNPRLNPLLLRNIELFATVSQKHSKLRNADARKQKSGRPSNELTLTDLWFDADVLTRGNENDGNPERS
jgi:hypothetical protein